MSYEVLARKLRPKKFSELVGQDHVVRSLTHALDNGRLHHAYLFTGTRGVGKTTIGRILAKSLNCESGVSSNPCGLCSICEEVSQNRFIDLLEVDAASRTGVDDTRELLENVQYLPTRGRFKVYLIDEVHMLSTASFNALLKTLEEPPDHVKFLLATTDPKKVPITVLSRCLQFQLRNITSKGISDYLKGVLKNENVEFENEGLELIAKNARGSMRDALTLVDQCISYGSGSVRKDSVVEMLGLVEEDEISSVILALEKGSAEDLLLLSEQFYERNISYFEVLNGIVERFHQYSVASFLGEDNQTFSREELQLFYQIALLGLRDIDIAPDHKVGFEMTLMRLLAFSREQQETLLPREKKKTNTRFTEKPSAHRDIKDVEVEEPASLDSSSPKTSTEDGVPIFVDDVLLSRWVAFVETLNLDGVTKAVIENSVAIKFALPNVDLIVEKDYEKLITESLLQKLELLFKSSLGENVKLTAQTGVLGSESPRKRKIRLHEEKIEKSKEALSRDPTMESLISEFNASIDHVIIK